MVVGWRDFLQRKVIDITSNIMTMQDYSDDELVRLAVSGDARAFEQLAQQHYMMVYKVAYKWCGVREEAEDITQEVFIKLARNIGNFQFNSEFKTWLYRITVNTVKDFHRSNARKQDNRQEFATEMREEAGKTGGNQEEKVLAAQIYQEINKLPDKLKDTALLVFGEGLSHKEVAEILDCAEKTVSWRVFQVKKKLKGMLVGSK